MSGKKIEWGKEIASAGSEIAEAAGAAGVPGIGLIGKFAERFYERHLRQRFGKFVTQAEVDEDLVKRILADESYSNCFYAVLETVRQTHSKIGLCALALIYRDHWNEESYLIGAMQSFSQISDKTVEAFINLYESIPVENNYLSLKVKKGEGEAFHEYYNEAVELIRRNIFVMSSGTDMFANGPIQGMKWFHTESYYNYCKAAMAIVNKAESAEA